MTTSLRPLAPRFDVLDPLVARDPYPTYARLREAGALCRGGPATWVVPRYAEVATLLRDERLGHAGPPDPAGGDAGAPATTAGRAMLASVGPNPVLTHLVAGLDGGDHLRVRHGLRQAIDADLAARIEQRVRAAAAVVLARACDLGCTDAVADLALPVQTAAAATLLGVAPHDQDEVVRRATRLGRALICLPFASAERGTGEDDARWLCGYVGGLLVAGGGPGAVPARLAALRGPAGLSTEEVVENAAFLFFAGFETMVNLISTGCALLAAHPGQFQALRRHRGLVGSAVEEVLRFDAPIQWVSRVVKVPVSIGETTLRPGRLLLLLLGSANRDGRQFENPDAFDVTRSPNSHMSFAGGSHHCLGVALARRVATVVFEAITSAWRDIAWAGEGQRRCHPNIRGYARVPLAVSPA